MRVHCWNYLPILVLCGFLATLRPANAATATPAQPPPKPPSTYPQIVRLSYVEGDVRISRGKLADKEDEKAGNEATGWEQAVTNLPIESGDSLVTGKGRAEIEFEDASVIYLADNSVLTFSELSTTSGVPYSEMSLLSGTATLNAQTMAPGERFLLHTPTDFVSLRYPQKAYLRVDSYLDAISVTPLDDMTVRLPGLTAPRSQVAGQTMTYNHARRVSPLVPVDSVAPSDWNTWVAERVAARDEAMSAIMKEAGLSAPIPGLDQMNGQGKFFACEPYGTCWEPTNGWDGHLSEVALAKSPLVKSPTGSEPAAQDATAAEQTPQANVPTISAGSAKLKNSGQSNVGFISTQAYLASHPGALLRTEDFTFPCSDYGVRYLVATDPVTGKDRIIASSESLDGNPFPDFGIFSQVGYPRFGYRHFGYPYFGVNSYFGNYPWNWAVCHAGTWIRWRHRYVWVAGLKRHHHRPIHWVKVGRTVGFVPIHPRDVAGKPPINLKSGVFKVTGKGNSVAFSYYVDFDEGKPLKLLDDAPKEFRKPVFEPLKTAEIPHAEARSAFREFIAAGNPRTGNGAMIAHSTVAGAAAARGFAAKPQGVPITFDRKSQSFSVAHEVMQGGRSTSIAQPLGGGRASFQGNNGSSGERGGSYGGAQQNRASSSGNNSNGGGASRSYSAPSGGSNGGGNSHASAPAPSSSGGGGGSSSGSSGGAAHK